MNSKIKKLALSAGALMGAMGISAFAEDTAAATTSGFGSYSTIIWLVVMLALFYFLLIRPQKKKEKSDRQLRNSLQAGDKIITIGGFTGKVLTVKDDEVTFETGATKTKLTVKKWAIQSKEGPVDASADKEPEQKSVEASTDSKETDAQ